MDRGLVDEEPRHLLEVRLPVEVGARSLAVAGPQPESDGVQGAEVSPIDQPPSLAVPGRPADVLVHDEQARRALGALHDRDCLGVGRRERLLADRGKPAGGRRCDETRRGSAPA